MKGRSPVLGRVRALVLAFPLCAAPASSQEAFQNAGAPARTVSAQADQASAGAEQSAVDPTPTTRSAPATPTPTPTATAEANDLDLPGMDEIVIVGRRKRGEAERDPTASATVIDAERFAGETKEAAELVATAPGVAVNQYGGLGHFTSVSIRGASADGVLVLLDGIPLETAFGGGVDLSTIPRQWIDRIEVVRGVEGAYYGAGALGGVVNVVTRSRASGWTGELTGGSYETLSASGETAFSAGAWSGLIGATGDTTGGGFHYEFDAAPTVASSPLREELRHNDAVRRGGLIAKLSRGIGASRLETVAHLSGGRRELPGSPYRLTPKDWQEDGRALVAARLSGPAPWWSGVLLAGRVSLRGDWLETRVEPALLDQRGGAAGLSGEARVLHRGGQLRATVEGQGETLRSDGIAGTRSRATLAAALSEDLFVAGDRLRISPAVRAERIGDFSGVSAKLGGSLRLLGPLALRASGGRTFRAPSFAELYLTQGIVQPNPDLRSEEGLGGDAALVVDVPAVHASAGAYATLYRDLIYYEQASLGRLKPFNSGKALVRGLEAEAATAPAPALLGGALAASYTLLDTENLRGVEGTLGNELPRRARHRLFARASIAPGRFGAHVEAHRVSGQFSELRNLRVIPAATTWNAGAAVRLSRNVGLHAEVRNVLDDRELQDALGNPLPGRMVLVTLRGGSRAQEVTP